MRRMADDRDAPDPLAAARTLFETTLGRPIEPQAEAALSRRIAAGSYDAFALLVELIGSSEFTNRLLANKVAAHLGLINRARQIMVRRLLPAAQRIIDLGGINSPLVDMGYAHPFHRMVMVDLAPDERHALYRDARFGPRDAAGIQIHAGDMTRLEAFADASFDLAWSGQSIEHVDCDAGARMCAEVFRVLAPGGVFCLDTPNRGITALHTREVGGGFIHPEHKHEYAVRELRDLLAESGFEIAEARGICEMPFTRATGVFHYEDFVLGNPIVDDPEAAYIMYFAARKPSR
jgi:ubiquinone/menaquinone biosynthesis C-methylase UbiE